MVRIASALLALAASASLAGCAYGGLGYGTDGYYDGYYGSGGPYYGWYDGYYYPGAGYYVYDHGGRRHKWDDHHRSYWQGHRHGRDGRENWAEFGRGGARGDRGERAERGERQGGKRGGDRAEWRGRQREDGNGNRGEWRGGQRGDGQAAHDRGPRNAPDAANGGAAGRPDPATREAWRDARREQRAADGQASASRGDAPRENAEVAQQSRPERSHAVAESRSESSTPPANRREAMRRMRDGED